MGDPSCKRINFYQLAFVSALLSSLLAGCGDKAASKTATGVSSPEAVALAAVPAAGPSPSVASGIQTVSSPAPQASTSDKSQDVMKWIAMSPDKVIKVESTPNAVDAVLSTDPKAAKAALEKKTEPAPAKPVSAAAAPLVPAPAVAPVATPVTLPTAAAATNAPAAQETRPTMIALAAPSPNAPPTPAQAKQLTLVYLERPHFPVEAVRDGVTSGHVRARLAVNADGSVAKVDIVESEPHGVFDKVVRASAQHARYNPIDAATSTLVDFNFKNDE